MAKNREFIKLSEKKDNLGICCIKRNDYRSFLKNEGIISKAGNFLDAKGDILGKHNRIINYTIGQWRGLRLNLDFPVIVSEIRLDSNE